MASLPCATRQVENFDEQEYGDFLVTHEKLLEEFTHATWEQSRELMRVRGKCVQMLGLLPFSCACFMISFLVMWKGVLWEIIPEMQMICFLILLSGARTVKI